MDHLESRALLATMVSHPTFVLGPFGGGGPGGGYTPAQMQQAYGFNSITFNGVAGTGNKNVPASIYPDAITRASEAPITSAKSVVFDMSDEQPPSFGGTAGQGEWGLFQQFLRNPKDISGIQKKLEQAATAAYKKGK